MKIFSTKCNEEGKEGREDTTVLRLMEENPNEKMIGCELLFVQPNPDPN